MAWQLADRLAEFFLFSDLPKKHLKKIEKLAEVHEFKKGDVLVREGTFSRSFFVVLEGAADVSVRGRRRNSVGRGEFFGELAILNNAERSATVTATTNLSTAEFDSRDLKTLLESEPKIAFHMLQVLARRMQDMVVAPRGKSL